MNIEKIKKLREKVKGGEFIVIPPQMFYSFLKKTNAPSGLTDVDLCKGIILRAEIDVEIANLQKDIC